MLALSTIASLKGLAEAVNDPLHSLPDDPRLGRLEHLAALQEVHKRADEPEKGEDQREPCHSLAGNR